MMATACACSGYGASATRGRCSSPSSGSSSNSSSGIMRSNSLASCRRAAQTRRPAGDRRRGRRPCVYTRAAEVLLVVARGEAVVQQLDLSFRALRCDRPVAPAGRGSPGRRHRSRRGCRTRSRRSSSRPSSAALVGQGPPKLCLVDVAFRKGDARSMLDRGAHEYAGSSSYSQKQGHRGWLLLKGNRKGSVGGLDSRAYWSSFLVTFPVVFR